LYNIYRYYPIRNYISSIVAGNGRWAAIYDRISLAQSHTVHDIQ